MAERFFSEVPVNAAEIELTGDQAHHAANVMRLKPGDQTGLFDVEGREFAVTVVDVSRKKLLLRIESEREQQPDRFPRVTIAVALPKGDRQKFLVEKLVELGASALIPLQSSRSVAVPKESVVRRIEKQVIEACKQSGRSRLMKVSAGMKLKQLAEIQSDDGASTVRLLADPRCGTSIEQVLPGRNADMQVTVAVGPEGGFSDEEVAMLVDAGYQPFQIGDAVLRIETAAIAATTLIRS